VFVEPESCFFIVFCFLKGNRRGNASNESGGKSEERETAYTEEEICRRRIIYGRPNKCGGLR